MYFGACLYAHFVFFLFYGYSSYFPINTRDVFDQSWYSQYSPVTIVRKYVEISLEHGSSTRISHLLHLLVDIDFVAICHFKFFLNVPCLQSPFVEPLLGVEIVATSTIHKSDKLVPSYLKLHLEAIYYALGSCYQIDLGRVFRSGRRVDVISKIFLFNHNPYLVGFFLVRSLAKFGLVTFLATHLAIPLSIVFASPS